jgi:hypothetical protein
LVPRDPEVLRSFAGRVDIATGAITGADVGNRLSTSVDVSPGSTMTWAAHTVVTAGGRAGQFDGLF